MAREFYLKNPTPPFIEEGNRTPVAKATHAEREREPRDPDNSENSWQGILQDTRVLNS